MDELDVTPLNETYEDEYEELNDFNIDTIEKDPPLLLEVDQTFDNWEEVDNFLSHMVLNRVFHYENVE